MPLNSSLVDADDSVDVLYGVLCAHHGRHHYNRQISNPSKDKKHVTIIPWYFIL